MTENGKMIKEAEKALKFLMMEDLMIANGRITISLVEV
jgi:hypothetical protein